MTLLDEEIQVRELLAPLSRVEPAALPQSKRRRNRVLVAGFLAAALLASGVAIADGVNPFAGIGAADHAQTAQDVLDPAIADEIQSLNARPNNELFSIGELLPDTARLVGQLSNGRHFYVITTTTGELCAMAEIASPAAQIAMGCGEPLAQSGNPITIAQMQHDPSTPPISWGLAQDDVISVSFIADGSEQTVPVVNNVWIYEGQNDSLHSITVHYADGTTQTLVH
jgi:hypothetical protein